MNFIREREQDGNFTPHEAHGTDLPSGINHHSLFFKYYFVDHYRSTHHIDIDVLNLVDDNEDNPDDDRRTKERANGRDG